MGVSTTRSEEKMSRAAAHDSDTHQSPQKSQNSSLHGVGLEFPRVFSRADTDPFDECEWEVRSAVIGSERGEVVFEQRDVEIPKSWSQTATNIVVSKYFRGQLGTTEARVERSSIDRACCRYDHEVG